LVTFPAAASDPSWAEALAALVKDGRARSLEVRKINGAAVAPASSEAEALRIAGFVEGYRGYTIRG
jgi:ATP-dependent helicase Lhr and Lhr-like helicase